MSCLNKKRKLFSNNLSRRVVSPTASLGSDTQYFFLVRHGIYLSTSNRDDGLIELGRQQVSSSITHIIIFKKNQSNRHMQQLKLLIFLLVH